MATELRKQIVESAALQYGLQLIMPPDQGIDAQDNAGQTYRIKYRTTKGLYASTSFDFKSDEIEAPFDYLLGVLVDRTNKILGAIRVAHNDVVDLGHHNEDSVRLRWNLTSSQDPRILLLQGHP